MAATSFSTTLRWRARLVPFLCEEFVVSLVWLPVVPLLLWIKYHMLLMRGCLVSAAAADESAVSGQVLGWFQTLTLYRWELFWGLLLVPILLCLVTRVLPPKLRPLLAGLFSAVVLVFLYVEFECLKTVGTFSSCDLLCEAVWWGLDNPHLASPYCGFTPGVAKTAMLGVLMAACMVGTCQIQRRGMGRWTRRLAIGCPAAAGLVVFAAFLPWMAPTPFHQNALWTAMVSFAGCEHRNDPSFSKLQRPDLMQRYRQIAAIASAEEVDHQEGSAEGFDVFWYVFETLPAQCVQFSGPLDDLPTLRRLKEHAVVAPFHYTTYPYTLSATWSMLTSSYPVESRFMRQATDGREVPGVMSLLKHRGYDTSFYCPDKFDQRSKGIYAATGVQEVIQGTVMPDGQAARLKPIEFRLHRDELILEQVTERLQRLLAEDRRYCMMFEPQAGHGPWADLPGAPPKEDLYERGRAIIRLEDQWLARIVDLVESKGRLGKTLFVITGDHGVRTRVDDPGLDLGKLDERSFHVPCMIAAPGLFSSTRTITSVTSHIDLTPTVAQLMGLPLSPFWEGSPLWSPSLQTRRTFLWAGDYMGVDGYHQQGKFYMVDQLLGRQYVADRLQGDAFGGLPADDPLAQEIEARIRGARSFQYRWFELVPAAPDR